VWLVDPIDGTKNFAAGTGAFGVMVALVERGETTLSGIYLPVERDLYLAEHGAGSTWNGVRLVSQAPREPKLLGTVYTRLMPKDVRASLNERPENIVLGDSPQCAALEYGRIARGERDFALYYRLHPWDHAPGVLIVQEAGGVARRVTSSRENYAPRDSEPLLLVASDEARWEAVRRALLDGPAS
jgi:fructose-1,6-bisphosphatase/inositol monophosphatase family enzyme